MTDDTDSEVDALRAAYAALATLGGAARRRAMGWLSSRLDQDERAMVTVSVAIAASARSVRRILKQRLNP